MTIDENSAETTGRNGGEAGVLTFQSTPVSNSTGADIQMTPTDWRQGVVFIGDGDSTVVTGRFTGFTILSEPARACVFQHPSGGWAPPVTNGGRIPVSYFVAVQPNGQLQVGTRGRGQGSTIETRSGPPADIDRPLEELTERNSPPKHPWLEGSFQVVDHTLPYLWPGAIISGNDLMRGLDHVNEYPLPLKPIVYGTSTGRSERVDNPKRSTVVPVLNELSTVTSSQEAATEFSYHSASTVAELEAALGVFGSGWGATFAASGGITNNSGHNLVAVEVVTTYLRVGMELEDYWSQPSDLLSPTITLADLEHLPSNELPLVVTELTYGHKAFLVAETSAESAEFFAAIEASYSAAGIEGGGSVDVRYRDILNESRIQGAIYGVPAESGAKMLRGVSSITNFLESYIDAAKQDVVGIIGMQVKNLMNRNAQVPGGPVSVSLDATMGAWSSAGKEDSANLKLFGLLQVLRGVSGSDGGTAVWSVDNRTGDPARAHPDIWLETEQKDVFWPLDLGLEGIAEGPRSTFTVDPVDGQILGRGVLWDYYKRHHNRPLGEGESDWVSYRDFEQGTTTREVDLTCQSAENGTCVARFRFRLFDPTAH